MTVHIPVPVPASEVPPGKLPLYKSHKQVRAFKIERMLPSGDGAVVSLLGAERINQATVNAGYMLKHNPRVGGYYVLYKDGYASWSPAVAFEDGYDLVPSAVREKAHE